MQLDVRTLLVAVTLVTAFCAGARLLLWRTHPGIPGLAGWAWASICGTLALFLIIVRESLSDPVALSLAQILIAVGFVLAWDGFRRFLGRTPLSRTLLAVLAAGVLIPIAAALLTQSLTLRSSSNAAFIALISTLIARDLLSAASKGQLALRSTGWIYMVNAAFFLLRGIVAARSPEVVDTWNPDGLAALPALWWLCTAVATTLGMVLMTGERLQASLDRQASRDPLTGALNRRAFALLAEKELARARRYHRPFALLMMDLDHFKQINDRLGHGAGDVVLCEFVAVAQRILRSEDALCRIGGEEFVALLPDTLAASAMIAAERLRSAFAEENIGARYGERSLPFAITVSLGVGELKPGEGIDDLLRRTDVALYQSKRNGRNCCTLAGAAGRETGMAAPGPAVQGPA